jgi:Na+/proline symporter/signal transduction histidine kinase
MTNFGLGIFSIYYLGILFVLAYWAEYSVNGKKSIVNNPYVYSLSLAIYCTAWTFYGSVGRSVSFGLEYIAVYIGPMLAMPLWWIITKKAIRISKLQRITNIADFLSSRYGKNKNIGVIVTIFCLAAGIPYISLQLKAISNSFNLITKVPLNSTDSIWDDNTFYVALILILFTILFGTRKIEATERHDGLIFAIAAESVVKLIAFLSIGIYVTYFCFDGFADLFGKAIQQAPSYTTITSLNTNASNGDWFWHLLVAAMAILFLPRQFQVAVVENYNEKHLNKAMWLFPLYMFLINIFVIPISLGGEIIFGQNAINPDNYVLAIPLHFQKEHLVNLTYIGGFSAATSMIVLETIAISLMMSNNLIMPLILSNERWLKNQANISANVQFIRRFSIFIVVMLGYFYFKYISQKYSLVSLGFVSFVGVSQFAPSFIGGLFWKKGNQYGAFTGLTLGFVLWFFTLIIPSMISAGLMPYSIIQNGLWDIKALNPLHLFGMTGLDEISHGAFWSLLINAGSYILISINTNQNALEHNQAILFVDVFKYSSSSQNTSVWKGKAFITDISSLLSNFLGEEKANEIIEKFALENKINLKLQYADPRLVSYAENQLAGIVGTASARIMVASVAEEEKVSVEKVVEILKKSQELIILNKELSEKSEELKELTNLLQQNDKRKDDFLTTVTHELRTPLTSIKALTEIIFDNEDLEPDQRQHFLANIIKETDRLARLINQVLDLEKLEAGQYQMNPNWFSINGIINDSIEKIKPISIEKNISISFKPASNLPEILIDADTIIQVLINLISNAIKFANPHEGHIDIVSTNINGYIQVSIQDNGLGIKDDFKELIFEKFYQAENQIIKKPIGSGLGLAICKKIIEIHEGQIWVESQGKGSNFIFKLPIKEKNEM